MATGRASQRSPHRAAALMDQGRALSAEGRLDEAVARFEQALAITADHAGAHNDLGVLLIRLGRPAEAAASFGRAVTLGPDLAPARNNLGNALFQLGRLDEALAQYRAAVALDPGYVTARSGLGNTLRALGRPAEAVAELEAVVAAAPGRAVPHHNLALALQDLDRHAEAIACFQRAAALHPDQADIHGNLGVALAELGRLGEAEAAVETAIRLAPRVGRFRRALADIRRCAAGDPLIAAMEDLAADPAQGADERMKLHFSLGKALDDSGDPARAFEHLRQGNALKRAGIAYDEAAALAWLERIAAVFSRDFLHARAGLGHPSPVPVFVVGMPRSGSTLMEQILASHPLVFGAGECATVGELAAGLAPSYPEAVAELGDGRWRELGAACLAGIAARAPDAERVVDKMPANFAHVGLIHLALPNARIIHAVRDPVDTCLSCYSKLFKDGQDFTYDLVELGRYWRATRRLMRHWQEVLPAGVMMEVAYEDLVADLEGQTRRMLAHVGLDWHDGCLQFHRTQRVVRTASSAQVRRPLYAGAVGRWQAYGRERLRPLLDELEK